MEKTFEAIKNWGRWGPDDEAGALNYITPKQRVAAAALVRDGFAVSCARELPVEPSIENPHPAHHHMLMAGDVADSLVPDLGVTMDYIGVAFHGMATSHIDAFCHVAVNGKLYNGFSINDVKSNGARRGSIMVARDGIVGRGVLLDIPRLRGVQWLEPQERILPEELERAEAAAGLRVGEGDLLLVATGRDARRAARGPWHPTEQGLAGLDARCVPWLHERRISVLGSDGVSDALPGGNTPGWPLPLHQFCLVGMGVHLLDNLALAELAAACAERQRWEFLFTVAPLRVAGGTGSPVNPIAVF
jgi:kynurenine formamidase